MDAVVVVVVYGECNSFIQLSDILVLSELAKLRLETAKEALHESVLPGTSLGAATERNLVAVTGQLVFVTQVLRTLVTVQDAWARMFGESICERGVRQLTGVAHAQSPSHNLPRLEIQHYR